METKGTDKQNELEKASWREVRYGALVFGILTWVTFVCGGYLSPRMMIVASIVFSWVGISYGIHALKTDERLVAWERLAAWGGMVLCVFFIIYLFSFFI